MPILGPTAYQTTPEVAISDPRNNRTGRTLHLPQNTNRPPTLVPEGYSCVMFWDEALPQGSAAPPANPQGSGGQGGGGGAIRGWKFSPDPVSIGWSANAQITLLPTRGGQVAYSTGRSIGPLTIAGYVRSSTELLDMADFIYAHMEAAQLRGRPLRFQYPERDFDFSMYIQNFNEIGLNGDVGEIKAWTITAQITQDHNSVAPIQVSKLLPGIPENIEWIDVESLAKIAQERFGIPVPGQKAPAPAGTGEDKPAEDTPPEGEKAPDKPAKQTGATTPDGGFNGKPVKPGTPFKPPKPGSPTTPEGGFNGRPSNPNAPIAPTRPGSPTSPIGGFN